MTELHEIPATGFEVLTVTFSSELYLTAWGEASGPTDGGTPAAPTVYLAFGGRFVLGQPDGARLELDASDAWPRLTPVLGLRHDRIASAIADRTGQLEIRFESGSTLSADADSPYENWRVTGPGDLELIAPPGGGDPYYRG
jgi:hypothetical protein